jgi:hypothetical protein
MEINPTETNPDEVIPEKIICRQQEWIDRADADIDGYVDDLSEATGFDLRGALQQRTSWATQRRTRKVEPVWNRGSYPSNFRSRSPDLIKNQ